MRTIQELDTQALQGKGTFVVSPAEWLLLINEKPAGFTYLEDRTAVIHGRQVVVHG